MNICITRDLRVIIEVISKSLPVPEGAFLVDAIITFANYGADILPNTVHQVLY